MNKHFFKQFSCASHSNILLLVRKIKYVKLEALLNEKKISALLLVENIQDPTNIGRIARLSFSFNIDGLIISKKNNTKITTSIERTSTGLISLIPVTHIKNIKKCIDYLKTQNFNIIGSSSRGYYNIKFHIFMFPMILIVGNEYKGISLIVNKYCDNIIFIPSKHSINIADAIAIFLYEIYIQRFKKECYDL